MEPIPFNEANITYSLPGAMPKEGDMPAYRNQKQIVSCWNVPFHERVKILITGKVWCGVIGKMQPAMWLDSSVPFYRATLIDNIKYLFSELEERLTEK